MTRRHFTQNILGSAVATQMPNFLGKKTDQSPFIASIKPQRLCEGDTIGLIAPAGNITDVRVQKAVANIQSLGFKVKMGRHILDKYGYLAGSELRRVEDIHAMFSDPEVRGIWCVRGGYGVTRLLHLLDYKLIKKNPKPLIGYSDITALHQAIFVKTGLVGFHGQIAAADWSDYTIQHLKNVLMHPSPEYTIALMAESESGYTTEIINQGVAEGRLMGGNLSLLASLTGTDYEWWLRDSLVFMEDIEEKPYRIDRMLTQLLAAGELQKAKGIALGVFHKCEPDANEDSFSLMEVLRDRLGSLNVPIVYGLSFGHIKHQCLLPVGIQARLDTQNRTLTLLEAAVS